MTATDLERGWLPDGAGCRYGCGGKVRHNDSCVYAEWRTDHGFVHPYRDGACELHGTLYCSICTRRTDECIYGSCREYAETADGSYCPAHAPECSICGDEHGESAHGEPLVIRDHYARHTHEAVGVYLMDAQSIVGSNTGSEQGDSYWTRLEALWTEYDALSDDERDEFASEYLDDIDSILSDAGYLPVTDADQGTWSVYAPTVSDVESAVGTGR